MVVSPREFIFVSVGSVVVSLAVVAGLWPWARQIRRLAVIAVACAVGIVLWNLALNVGDAAGFNVDGPVLGLSLQDVGSGVLAFATTALALGLLSDQSEPAGRVVGAAAVVGIVTMLVDLLG